MPKNPISTSDLRAIVDALSRPPFNKTKLSVIELHDHFSHPDLVQLINEVIAHIDHSNPNSPHTIDMRNEVPDVTGARMADFLFHGIKWQLDPIDVISANIVTGTDRSYLLQILHYILQDIPKMRQLAYKSRFCQPMEIPSTFLGDEQIQDLVEQLSQQQIEFSDVLDQAEQLHLSAQTIADLKRDVSQMEEEKTLVHGKIQRMQRKVADIPNKSTWLQACRALRNEQDRELQLNNQIKDFKLQCTKAEERATLIEKQIAYAKDMYSVPSNQILDRFKNEVDANKTLVSGQLSKKQLDSIAQTVSHLQKINNDPPLPMSDLVKLEHEIDSLNEQLKDFSEKRLQTTNTQDKLALFRQQVSAIISKKKETAEKLLVIQAEYKKAEQEHAKIKEHAQANPKLANIPKGDAFKAYINELRTKSNTFKTKRGLLANLNSEIEIAIKTRDILIEKRNLADRNMQMLEQRHGVSGLRRTKIKLEEISERKGTVDQEKATVVQEMTDLVQSLTTAIHTKKQTISPKLNELKLLKSTLSTLENECEEHKRTYNAKVLSLETEIEQLKQSLSSLHAQEHMYSTQWHTVVHESELLDLQMDLVMNEMKAGIGTVSESVVPFGHKTWSDLYKRQILEVQATLTEANTHLCQVESLHDSKMLQVQFFSSIQAMLNAKILANTRLLNQPKGSKKDRAEEIVTMNEQRLVIS